MINTCTTSNTIRVHANLHSNTMHMHAHLSSGSTIRVHAARTEHAYLPSNTIHVHATRTTPSMRHTRTEHAFHAHACSPWILSGARSANSWDQISLGPSSSEILSGSQSGLDLQNNPWLCMDVLVPYHESDEFMFIKNGGFESAKRHLKGVRKFFILTKEPHPTIK